MYNHNLSKVLTSCLTAIKNHWIKYCEKGRNKLDQLANVFRYTSVTLATPGVERSNGTPTGTSRLGINYFWSIKNSTEILNKLKAKVFQASTISTYDFLRFILPYHTIRLKSTC